MKGRTRTEQAVCSRCAGLAWVCEHHPNLPFQHARESHADACRGDGLPCNCAAGRFLVAVMDARNHAGMRSPARDECVLWRLVSETGEPFVCHVLAGRAGELALTVERRNGIIVAEMTSSLDAATARAEELRSSLVAQGLREPPELSLPGRQSDPQR